MGVILIRILLSLVCIGIYRFVLIVILVRFVGENLFDILVLKKDMVDSVICVVNIGRNMIRNCFIFCEKWVVVMFI